MSAFTDLLKSEYSAGGKQLSIETLQKYDPDQPRDEAGMWTDGGSGGAATKTGNGKQGSESAIKAGSAKAFNEQVDAIYKEQGVEDWQGDYFAELDARTYFGNEQSFRVNAGLRGEKMDKRTKEAAERFAKAFDKSSVEISEGSTVYRAVSGEFSEQLRAMGVGDSYIDDGYASTAGVKSSTKNFGDTLMEITVGSGVRGMIYRNENEVLLAPGRKFTIGKSRQSGGKTIIEVHVS